MYLLVEKLLSIHFIDKLAMQQTKDYNYVDVTVTVQVVSCNVQCKISLKNRIIGLQPLYH